MPTAARAPGAPAAPAGAPHSGASYAHITTAGHLSFGGIGGIAFQSHRGDVLAATEETGSDYQYEHHSHHMFKDDNQSAAEGRETTSPAYGRSSTIKSARRSPSRLPRVPPYSSRTATVSGAAHAHAALRHHFGTCESEMLRPSMQAAEQQQQQSSGGKLKGTGETPFLQPRRLEGELSPTDTLKERDDVREGRGRPATGFVKLKPMIPSVLVTSPSLGCISVICARDAPRSVSTAPSAEKSAMHACKIEAKEEGLGFPTPAAAEEKSASVAPVYLHVTPASPEPAPPPVPAHLQNIRQWRGNTPAKRKQELVKRATADDRDIVRLRESFPPTRAAHMQSNEVSRCIDLHRSVVLSPEAEVTGERQTAQAERAASDVTGGEQYESAASTAEGRLGNSSILGSSDVVHGRIGEEKSVYYSPTLFERTSGTAASGSWSFGPITSGRSGGQEERHRRMSIGGGQRSQLHSDVSAVAAPGSESGRAGGGADYCGFRRRRFSLPAEGATSGVHGSGDFTVEDEAKSITDFQGGGNRCKGVPLNENKRARGHRESEGRALVDQSDGEKGGDFVRSDPEYVDSRFFPPQPSASSNYAWGEGKISASLAVEEPTALATTVTCRATTTPDLPSPLPRVEGEEASKLISTASCSERRGSNTFGHKIEEKSETACADQLSASVLARSTPLDGQGRFQAPLLSAAFRAAADAAAAGARIRTPSAMPGGGNKALHGAGGTPAGSDKPGKAPQRGLLVTAGVSITKAGDPVVSSLRFNEATFSSVGEVRESVARDFTSDAQVWRRDREAGLRTTSGISLASSYDQSGATRPLKEKQQRELLLLKAEQRRAICELAAVAACVAGACVKRVALVSVQQLILSALQRWHESVESVPWTHLGPNRVATQGRRHLSESVLKADRVKEAEQSLEANVPSDAVGGPDVPCAASCGQRIPMRRAVDLPVPNTVAGIKCVCTTLVELLRGSLPKGDDGATPKDKTYMRKAAEGTAPGENDGSASRRDAMRCVRVTLFASKQVLRWRHLRQRVELFTEKTSPYYYWPPWGGICPLLEAKASTVSSKLLTPGEINSVDGRLGTIRQVGMNCTETEEEFARTNEESRRKAPLARKEEDELEESTKLSTSGSQYSEVATSTTGGKTNFAGQPQGALPKMTNEDARSPLKETKVVKAAHRGIAGVWLAPVTPTRSNLVLADADTPVTSTKSNLGLADADIQKDTAAIPSSPPKLNDDCVSPPALAPQQTLQFFEGQSKQHGEGLIAGLPDVDNNVSSRPAPATSFLSTTLPAAPTDKESRVNVFEVSCTTSGAAPPSDGDNANSAGAYSAGKMCKREQPQKGEEKFEMENRGDGPDTNADEIAASFSFKDKHAIVPFLPNVLASVPATGTTTAQVPLRLPFKEAGVVYVLRASATPHGYASHQSENTKHAGSTGIAGAAGYNIDASMSDTSSGHESSGGLNVCSGVPQAAEIAPASAEENGRDMKPRTTKCIRRETSPGGKIIAIWACAAGSTASREKAEEPVAERSGILETESACPGQETRRRLWLCADARNTGGMRDGGTNSGIRTAERIMDNSSVSEARTFLDSMEASLRPLRRGGAALSMSISKVESEAPPSTGASCPQNRRPSISVICSGDQSEAEEVVNAMCAWCCAAGRTATDSGEAGSDSSTVAACPLREISFESFACAYNDLAEEAVKQLLTRIRTRGQYAPIPPADQLVEESSCAAFQRRKEEARFLQQQLREKLQQLVQNYNKLVTAGNDAGEDAPNSDRDHADATRSLSQARLEQLFQRRLQDLQQRVEFHLQEHRKLAASLICQNSRQERLRQPPHSRRPSKAFRRRLRWYSVGIRWLRSCATLEYFVVRHRQHEVVERIPLHAAPREFPRRVAKEQSLNREEMEACEGHLPGRGLPIAGAWSNLSSKTPSASDPSHAADDRTSIGLKSRVPEARQRRINSCSSGEDWKISGRSTGFCGAWGAASTSKEEESKSAFRLPITVSREPLGMSPVTVSDASTPATAGTPPLSSNEDGVSAMTYSGSVRQRGWATGRGVQTRTSSVLVLHELLQPTRLDAGGIRAAIMLVVQRLRHFIRVVRAKKRPAKKEMLGEVSSASMLSDKETPGPGLYEENETTSDPATAAAGKTAQGTAATQGRNTVSTTAHGGTHIRAHISELTELQKSCTVNPTIAEGQDGQGCRSADTMITVSDVLATQSEALPRSLYTSDRVYSESALAQLHCAGGESGPNDQQRMRRAVVGENEDTPQAGSQSRSLMDRQFPWSNIRMALVLPSLGVELNEVLPCARYSCGRRLGQPWTGGAKDEVVGRGSSGVKRLNQRGRFPGYERNGFERASLETLSQTSQRLCSGSQSPAPRRLGGGSVGGAGDAAEARAARAAARAAAAETRSWKLREREEVEARLGGLSDHATYSWDASGGFGKTRKSRARPFSERSNVRGDGEGVSEIDGEDEEEGSEEPRSFITATGLFSLAGKDSEIDSRSAQPASLRNQSSQVSQRVTRSCGIFSAFRSDSSARRTQLGPGSDEDSYPEIAESPLKTQVHANVGEDDGQEFNLLPIESGALEPFWWRACCAKFHEGKESEQRYKNASCKVVVGQSLQSSLNVKEEEDGAQQAELASSRVAEGKKRCNVAINGGQRTSSSGAEAAEHSSREGSVKRTQTAPRDEVVARSSPRAAAAFSEAKRSIVSGGASMSASSSEFSSLEEESGSEKGTSTASDSSVWSRHSSAGSDVSVERSTILQQLSARQVAAEMPHLFNTGTTTPFADRRESQVITAGTQRAHNGLQTTPEAPVCGSVRSTLPLATAEPVFEPPPGVGIISAAAQQKLNDEFRQNPNVTNLPASCAFKDISGARFTPCTLHRSVDGHELSRVSGVVSVPRLADAPSVRDEQNLQSVVAGGLREQPPDDGPVSVCLLAAAAPHLIPMPSEEEVLQYFPNVAPQLRVSYTTCAVDLTPKKESQLLQWNTKETHSSLRPPRAVRRLWRELHPIIHTLQTLNEVEEGREEKSTKMRSWSPIWTRIAPAVSASGTKNPGTLCCTRETVPELISSALLLAAAELVKDVSVSGKSRHPAVLVTRLLSEQAAPISNIAYAIARAYSGQSREESIVFPQLLSPLSHWVCQQGAGVTGCMEKGAPIRNNILATVTRNAMLYLSGVLDIETARVEAAKEAAEDDALLHLLQFPGAQATAEALSRAPANPYDAADRHSARRVWSRIGRTGSASHLSKASEAHTEEIDKWRKKKRLKTEESTRSHITHNPDGQLPPSEKQSSSVEYPSDWEESGCLESPFDFGPRNTVADGETSKIILRCPRAFGKRAGVMRRTRISGQRSGLASETATAFHDNWGGERFAEGTSEDVLLAKNLRLPSRLPWSGYEGVTAKRWASRSRSPLLLQPDHWETADETAPSSSAEKTSGYAPFSSGSESRYLSLPGSPRRRRQQRQRKWRSRHLAASDGRTYHLTSAERRGEHSPERLEQSLTRNPRRAYGVRAPRRAGVGSVFQLHPNLCDSTLGTEEQHGALASQPPSPPLTRGAAAPRSSQIDPRAAVLSAGQGDVEHESESTGREKRKTTQPDRQLSGYICEKLGKRQFAPGPSDQVRRKSSVGRVQRSRAVPVMAAPSLEWSGPENGLATPRRKKPTSPSMEAVRPGLVGGIRHHLTRSEGAAPASSGAGVVKFASTTATRATTLDSPRETPRPGRRTPTAGSPVPTGVYFDASRKLWRCQWRENGRFKTKGFSLNTYGTLKDARKACIVYRCLMGGWEVDPRWLADNDSPDSGDNALSEGNTSKGDETLSRSSAFATEEKNSELAHGAAAETAQRAASETAQWAVAETAQSAAACAMQCDAVDASQHEASDIMHSDGVDAGHHGTAVSDPGEAGPAGSEKPNDADSLTLAAPVTHGASSP